jgi:YfiH family protein
MRMPPEPFELRGEHIAIELPGAAALFTTRRGGSSRGPYASLNLGMKTADRREAVMANRAALSNELGLPLTYVRQVHGKRVVTVPEEAQSTPEIPEADGQATAMPRTGLLILAADCLPVAVASEGAVAMLHAGWKGLAAGVIEEGVRALRALVGRGPVHAAIGPGAGPCCYEVGEEVHAQFGTHGRTLDLKAIARDQLGEAGAETIHDVGLCTMCAPELFFSHRRDRGVTGRQAGIAWLT